MVQVNLRNENYNKAVRNGISDVTEWVNQIAEKELAKQEPCAVDIAREARDKK